MLDLMESRLLLLVEQKKVGQNYLDEKMFDEVVTTTDPNFGHFRLTLFCPRGYTVFLIKTVENELVFSSSKI